MLAAHPRLHHGTGKCSYWQVFHEEMKQLSVFLLFQISVLSSFTILFSFSIFITGSEGLHYFDKTCQGSGTICPCSAAPARATRGPARHGSRSCLELPLLFYCTVFPQRGTDAQAPNGFFRPRLSHRVVLHWGTVPGMKLCLHSWTRPCFVSYFFEHHWILFAKNLVFSIFIL